MPKAPRLRQSTPVLPEIRANQHALLTWRQFVHTFLRLQSRLEKLAFTHGLGLSQAEALVRVGRNPGMIQQDLSRALILTKGNIGILMSRLERLGFLERRADARDRRIKRLYLSNKGHDIASRFLEARLPVVENMLAPLSAKELGDLRKLLAKLECADSE